MRELTLGKIGVNFYLTSMKYKLNMPKCIDREIKKFLETSYLEI